MCLPEDEREAFVVDATTGVPEIPVVCCQWKDNKVPEETKAAIGTSTTSTTTTN